MRFPVYDPLPVVGRHSGTDLPLPFGKDTDVLRRTYIEYRKKVFSSAAVSSIIESSTGRPVQKEIQANKLSKGVSHVRNP